MSEIKVVNIDKISPSYDIYYGGWSDAELTNYRNDYQSRFVGDDKDFKLEIITDELNIYYVICRAGQSFKKQCQFFIEETQSVAVINANGNIYRFDINQRKFLDISCYKEILFDNTQNKGNISPYLKSEISPDKGIMVIVDDNGIAAINWNKVLWKQKYAWAYADYIQFVEITKTSVIIKIEPPDGDMKKMSLNILTGDVNASNA